MPEIEPVVTAEKLSRLLAEQVESESLDFKQVCDLNDRRGLVEIAKDVGAMMGTGGYIVIGVDDRGALTTEMTTKLASLFDEANLRQKLIHYLTAPFTVLCGTHDRDGKIVVLVYVAPHPDGFAIFKADGCYDVEGHDGKPRTKTVFNRGDVFVRHGTSSERWDQSDPPRLFRRRDERIREETRAEFAKTIAAIGQGTQAQQIAAGPAAAVTWQLDEATFIAVTSELIRREDRAPLRLLLLGASGDAFQAVNAGDIDTVRTILDRLTSLAAQAITFENDGLIQRTIRTVLAIYRLGFDTNGTQRLDLALPPALLWVEIVGRIEALGALAVRLDEWDSVRLLALQKPHERGPSPYVSWLRHGQVEGSRAGFLANEDGEKVIGALVARARTHANRLPVLRPDRPQDDAHNPDAEDTTAVYDSLLDSICQFDALRCIIAMIESGETTRGAQFYPSFAAYNFDRTKPIIARLVTDSRVRHTLLPDATDGVLRTAIATLQSLSEQEVWYRLDSLDLSTPVAKFMQTEA
jgi:hypothetical protein